VLVESHPNVAKGATLGWGTPAERISTPLNPQNVTGQQNAIEWATRLADCEVR